MISIPAEIRKKYNISDGDYMLIKEEENDEIKIIPLDSEELLRKRGLTVEEFRKVLNQSRMEDLDIER